MYLWYSPRKGYKPKAESEMQEAPMAELTLSVGLVGEKSTLVCEHNVAPHVPRFSTPSMISLMEQVALENHLTLEQTSVGFEVNVRHLAPSSIGATVVAKAELTDIDRNRLTFSVEAFDNDTKIGEGTHRRAVISSNR